MDVGQLSSLNQLKNLSGKKKKKLKKNPTIERALPGKYKIKVTVG